MTELNVIADLDIDDYVGAIWMDIHNKHSISSSPAVKYEDISPNYRIIPSLRNTKIEPGDTVKLDIFISGYGLPDKTRLNIFGSIENIFEIKKDSVRIIPNISGYIQNGDVQELVQGPPARGLGLADERSFNGLPVSTPLPPVVFVDDPGVPGDRRKYEPHAYPNIVGESFAYDGATLRVEIDTKDADWYSSSWYSGEYPVQLVLLYGNDKETKITKENIPIKVRTRRDKFWWLTAIIALTAAATFIIRFFPDPITNLGLIRNVSQSLLWVLLC